MNCLGSQGYYAESAEILNKQRVHRVKPSVPVQGFNIVGGASNIGLDIKPKHTSVAQRARQDKKPDRRIDSNEEPSLESVDFEDISGEKQPHKIISNIENNSNDNESQITAESGLILGSKRRNDIYGNGNNKNERPTAETLERKSERTQNEGRTIGRTNGRNNDSRRGGNIERGSQRHGYSNLQNETTERPRSNNGSQRGQHRFREDKKPEVESFERQSSEDRKEAKKVLPEKYLEASGRTNNHVNIAAVDQVDVKPEYYEAQSSQTATKTQPTTTTYSIGTYTTARRLDSTRTTPYYTPTVPTVVKSKTATDGKGFYIKSAGANVAATTPNPNRYNAGSVSGLVLESSAVPKSTTESTTTSTVADLESTVATTLRPFIIGMRSNYNAPTFLETPRIPLLTTKPSTDSAELLTTTTPASTTGPTYLPKGSTLSRVNAGAAAGDALLFAPSPASDESVNRNVNEMLKTMNLLKDTISSSKIKDDVEQINFNGQSRTGLEIPPSSGPDALVSLAQYFANEQKGSTANTLNALDDKDKPSKSDESKPSHKVSVSSATISTVAAPVVTANSDDIKKSLLSEKTVNQYSSLFNLKDPRGKQQYSDPSDGLLSNRTVSGTTKTKTDSGIVSSPFPQIGSTDATIRQLAEKPESRKIAQVFSNALTTYLDDPKSFREQLASVRPTEPPIGGKANFQVVTVTDQTLFNGGTGATYLPTKPTPAFDLTTPKSANIAAEINKKFEYSTPVTTDFGSTTDAYDSTTPLSTSNDSHEQKFKLELSAELSPPSPESGEGEEFLQREQTQSFVKYRNEVESSEKQKQKANSNGAFVIEPKPTENPWNHISQSDFLDPLTINDGLMKEHRTTTVSPFTYLPKTTTTTSKRLDSGKQQLLSSNTYPKYVGKTIETPRSGQIRQSLESTDSTWFDIFNSYDIPRETLPSSSGLQRIANKLFGGLNETEALHLRNVMQQAEHNRQVLSLLLLLIQTCDDQNGKALERSRKHLLNALIDMDGKVSSAGKSSHHKAESRIGSAATTSRVPVTTFRRGGGDDVIVTSTNSYPTTTTTDTPSTTPFSASSTLSSGSVEETTKFEIRVEDLDDDFTGVTTTTFAPGGSSSSSSDKRALELLKSLYSLASKFTSRR